MRFWSVVLILLGSAACANEQAAIIRGMIQFQDENGANNPPYVMPAEMDVIFMYERSGQNVLCPDGKVWVDSRNFSFRYKVHDACRRKNLLLDTKITPEPPTWQKIPPSPQVSWIDGQLEYETVIKFKRARSQPRENRVAAYETGVRLLARNNAKGAHFLFAEASSGDDYEFTEKSIKLLNERGRLADAYPLFYGKEITKLQADKSIQFRLAMRKGDAAIAAGLTPEAVSAFAEAQNIDPTNDRPMTSAYTVLQKKLDSKDPATLAQKLSASENAKLRTAFSEVYGSWHKARPGEGINANTLAQIQNKLITPEQPVLLASVFGRVTDQTGGLLPGVEVTLRPATGPVRTTTTGATGQFRFPNVQPGNYAVTFSVPGFTQIQRQNVTVSAGRSVEVSVEFRIQ